jgi:hypothetical protein
VNTLLAMADAGHGVAIVPSILRGIAPSLQTCIVTHRREPLHLNVAVIWERRGAPTRYVEEFTTLLEEYVRETYRPATASDIRTPARRAKARPRMTADARPRRTQVLRSPRQGPGLAG